MYAASSNSIRLVLQFESRVSLHMKSPSPVAAPILNMRIQRHRQKRVSTRPLRHLRQSLEAGEGPTHSLPFQARPEACLVAPLRIGPMAIPHFLRSSIAQIGTRSQDLAAMAAAAIVTPNGAAISTNNTVSIRLNQGDGSVCPLEIQSQQSRCGRVLRNTRHRHQQHQLSGSNAPVPALIKPCVKKCRSSG